MARARPAGARRPHPRLGGRDRDGGPAAAGVRGGARPPPRRHLRHRRRPLGAERRARDEERRGLRSDQARGGRVRSVRRDRAGAPAAPRPPARRPDARARRVARGPGPGGRGHRGGGRAAGRARAHVAGPRAARALDAGGPLRRLGGARFRRRGGAPRRHRGRFTALRADEAHALWMRAAESFATRPVTFRVGSLPDSSDEPMDLLQHQVGGEWISASPGIGAIRWGGATTVDRLRPPRRTLAGLEVPLTLERAPWPTRAAVGHFGAYREGVGPLVAGLRRTFDPGEAFVVAVEGTE